MKYSEEEVEIIAKSMYKAVKKALGVGNSSETKQKVSSKNKKDAVDDLMDPNFIAEAKDKVPPTRQAQMNKSCMKKGKTSLYKLSDFLNKTKKKRKQ